MMSAAAKCRKNKWAVGTILEGADAWGGMKRIVITAIGKRKVLAHETTEIAENECQWDLDCRKWRSVRRA